VSKRSTITSPILVSPRELVVACAAVLAVFFAGVALKASGSRWAGGDAWTIGGDFAALYVAGRMLDEHDGAGLYDIELQERVYREVVPGASTLNRTFAYPPYIAALFSPLARLPFGLALAIFMVATLVAYLAALWLLNAAFGPTRGDERSLLFLAGLSFFPFLGYTWLGTQISTVGFLAVALALLEEERGRPLFSGMALSLCLYKPTLLVVMLPMLAVTGRVRQIVGFFAGAGLQVVLWLAIGGRASVAAFAEEIRWIVVHTTSTSQLFNPHRYVDINAFFRLLPFGRSTAGHLLLGVIASAAAMALVGTWWRSRGSDRAVQQLVWAATVTWTLVLNLYVPFYDTVLVVAAAVLAVAAVKTRAWEGWNRLGPALVCVYLAPWIAEVCARVFSVQIYTLVLSGFGALLLVEANRRSEIKSLA